MARRVTGAVFFHNLCNATDTGDIPAAQMCVPDGPSREMFLVFTVPVSGIWSIGFNGLFGMDDAILAVRVGVDACDPQGPELLCIPATGSQEMVLYQDEQLQLMVYNPSLSCGNFDISMTIPG